MALTAFLSRSPALLNRGPGDPAFLGHVPHSSIFSWIGGPEGPLGWVLVIFTASYLKLIWGSEPQLLIRESWVHPLLGAGSLYSNLSPTDLNFLSQGLYNNLTSIFLPASVTISHLIQPLDSQGYILIFLDRMHLLFTHVYFDSSAGVNMQQTQ